MTTTPASEPLLVAGDIRPGTHITALGSDSLGKQELDPRILRRADVVVVDSIRQTTHHGECAAAVAAGLIAVDDLEELGTVIDDPGRGRRRADDVTVADLTGVAVQDIQVAKMVYRALAR